MDIDVVAIARLYCVKKFSSLVDRDPVVAKHLSYSCIYLTACKLCITPPVPRRRNLHVANEALKSASIQESSSCHISRSTNYTVQLRTSSVPQSLGSVLTTTTQPRAQPPGDAVVVVVIAHQSSCASSADPAPDSTCAIPRACRPHSPALVPSPTPGSRSTASPSPSRSQPPHSPVSPRPIPPPHSAPHLPTARGKRTANA